MQDSCIQDFNELLDLNRVVRQDALDHIERTAAEIWGREKRQI